MDTTNLNLDTITLQHVITVIRLYCLRVYTVYVKPHLPRRMRLFTEQDIWLAYQQGIEEGKASSQVPIYLYEYETCTTHHLTLQKLETGHFYCALCIQRARSGALPVVGKQTLLP